MRANREDVDSSSSGGFEYDRTDAQKIMDKLKYGVVKFDDLSFLGKRTVLQYTLDEPRWDSSHITTQMKEFYGLREPREYVVPTYGEPEPEEPLPYSDYEYFSEIISGNTSPMARLFDDHIISESTAREPAYKISSNDVVGLAKIPGLEATVTGLDTEEWKLNKYMPASEREQRALDMDLLSNGHGYTPDYKNLNVETLKQQNEWDKAFALERVLDQNRNFKVFNTPYGQLNLQDWNATVEQMNKDMMGYGPQWAESPAVQLTELNRNNPAPGRFGFMTNEQYEMMRGGYDFMRLPKDTTKPGALNKWFYNSNGALNRDQEYEMTKQIRKQYDKWVVDNSNLMDAGYGNYKVTRPDAKELTDYEKQVLESQGQQNGFALEYKQKNDGTYIKEQLKHIATNLFEDDNLIEGYQERYHETQLGLLESEVGFALMKTDDEIERRQLIDDYMRIQNFKEQNAHKLGMGQTMTNLRENAPGPIGWILNATQEATGQVAIYTNHGREKLMGITLGLLLAPATGGMSTKLAIAGTSGADMFTIEGGNAYLEYISQGVPHDQARRAAMVVGAINGTVEVGQTFLTLAIAGFGLSAKTAGKGFTDRVLSKLGSKVVALTSKKALGSVVTGLARMGINTTSELAEEYIQSFVTDVGFNASVNSSVKAGLIFEDEIKKMSISEIHKGAWEEFKAAIPAMTIIGAIGGSVGTLVEVRNIGKASRALTGEMKSNAEIKFAESINRVWAELSTDERVALAVRSIEEIKQLNIEFTDAINNYEVTLYNDEIMMADLEVKAEYFLKAIDLFKETFENSLAYFGDEVNYLDDVRGEVFRLRENIAAQKKLQEAVGAKNMSTAEAKNVQRAVKTLHQIVRLSNVNPEKAIETLEYIAPRLPKGLEHEYQVALQAVNNGVANAQEVQATQQAAQEEQAKAEVVEKVIPTTRTQDEKREVFSSALNDVEIYGKQLERYERDIARLERTLNGTKSKKNRAALEEQIEVIQEQADDVRIKIMDLEDILNDKKVVSERITDMVNKISEMENAQNFILADGTVTNITPEKVIQDWTITNNELEFETQRAIENGVLTQEEVNELMGIETITESTIKSEETTGDESDSDLKDWSLNQDEVDALLQGRADVEELEDENPVVGEREGVAKVESKLPEYRTPLFAERTMKGVGNVKIASYRAAFPNTIQYFSKAAERVLIDLSLGQKGNIIPKEGENDFKKQPRKQSATVTRILNEVVDNYGKVEESLQAIQDGKIKNDAVTKRIEMILDDIMVNGYVDFNDEYVSPYYEYIELRNKIENEQIEKAQMKIVSEEEFEKTKRELGKEMAKPFDNPNFKTNLFSAIKTLRESGKVTEADLNYMLPHLLSLANVVNNSEVDVQFAISFVDSIMNVISESEVKAQQVDPNGETLNYGLMGGGYNLETKVFQIAIRIATHPRVPVSVTTLHELGHAWDMIWQVANPQERKYVVNQLIKNGHATEETVGEFIADSFMQYTMAEDVGQVSNPEGVQMGLFKSVLRRFARWARQFFAAIKDFVKHLPDYPPEFVAQLDAFSHGKWDELFKSIEELDDTNTTFVTPEVAEAEQEIIESAQANLEEEFSDEDLLRYIENIMPPEVFDKLVEDSLGQERAQEVLEAAKEPEIKPEPEVVQEKVEKPVEVVEPEVSEESKPVELVNGLIFKDASDETREILGYEKNIKNYKVTSQSTPNGTTYYSEKKLRSIIDGGEVIGTRSELEANYKGTTLISKAGHEYKVVSYNAHDQKFILRDTKKTTMTKELTKKKLDEWLDNQDTWKNDLEKQKAVVEEKKTVEDSKTFVAPKVQYDAAMAFIKDQESTGHKIELTMSDNEKNIIVFYSTPENGGRNYTSLIKPDGTVEKTNKSFNGRTAFEELVTKEKESAKTVKKESDAEATEKAKEKIVTETMRSIAVIKEIKEGKIEGDQKAKRDNLKKRLMTQVKHGNVEVVKAAIDTIKKYAPDMYTQENNIWEFEYMAQKERERQTSDTPPSGVDTISTFVNKKKNLNGELLVDWDDHVMYLRFNQTKLTNDQKSALHLEGWTYNGKKRAYRKSIHPKSKLSAFNIFDQFGYEVVDDNQFNLTVQHGAKVYFGDRAGSEQNYSDNNSPWLERYGYKEDRGRGKWLENTRTNAQQILLDKYKNSISSEFIGKKATYVGKQTASFEIHEFPLNFLIENSLGGLNNEQFAIGNPKYSQVKFEQVIKSLRENGYDDNYPIIVYVDAEGGAFIAEGNNRLEAAKQIQKEYDTWMEDHFDEYKMEVTEMPPKNIPFMGRIPVRFIYFDGGEGARYGAFYPDKLVKHFQDADIELQEIQEEDSRYIYMKRNMGREDADLELGMKLFLNGLEKNRKGFSEWFDGSVVVNKDGSPKKMNHGTLDARHDVMDQGRSRVGLVGEGSYYTDNYEVAKGYAGMISDNFDPNKLKVDRVSIVTKGKSYISQRTGDLMRNFFKDMLSELKEYFGEIELNDKLIENVHAAFSPSGRFTQYDDIQKIDDDLFNKIKIIRDLVKSYDQNSSILDSYVRGYWSDMQIKQMMYSYLFRTIRILDSDMDHYYGEDIDAFVKNNPRHSMIMVGYGVGMPIEPHVFGGIFGDQESPLDVDGLKFVQQKFDEYGLEIDVKFAKPPNGVYEVYLSIKNPLDLDTYVPTFEQALKLGITARWFKEGTTLYDYLNDHFGNSEFRHQVHANLKKNLKAQGYDGVTHIGGRRVGHVKHRVYVSYYANQVKSVFNETFNANELDMHLKVLGNRPGNPFDQIRKNESDSQWLKKMMLEQEPGSQEFEDIVNDIQEIELANARIINTFLGGMDSFTTSRGRGKNLIQVSVNKSSEGKYVWVQTSEEGKHDAEMTFDTKYDVADYMGSHGFNDLTNVVSIEMSDIQKTRQIHELQNRVTVLEVHVEELEEEAKTMPEAVRPLRLKKVELFKARADLVTKNTEPVFRSIVNDYHAGKDLAKFRASVVNSGFRDRLKKMVGEKSYGVKSKALAKDITMYIDLLGQEEIIEEYIDFLTPEDQEWVKRSQDLSDDAKALARDILEFSEEIGLMGLKGGVLTNIRENHLSRMWIQDYSNTGTSSNVDMGSFYTRTNLAKHRVFGSMLEGLLKGMKLAKEDVTDVLLAQADSVIEAVENKRLMDSLKVTRDYDGRRLIRTDGKPGYTRINHPNFKVWEKVGEVSLKQARLKDLSLDDIVYDSESNPFRVVDLRMTDEEIQDEMAHEIIVVGNTPDGWKAFKKPMSDIKLPPPSGNQMFIALDGTVMEKVDVYMLDSYAKEINNKFDPSYLNTIDSKGVIQGITKANAVLKKWVLNMSLYHHMAFMRSYHLGVGKKGKGNRTVLGAYKNGLKAIEEMNADLELMIENGLTLGLIQDWEQWLLSQGKSQIKEWMNKYKATEAISNKVLNLRDGWTDFLFQRFGAGLKAQAALIEFKFYKEKFADKLASGEMSESQIAAAVAELMNNDFGGLHLERMGRNKTLQHIMRMSLLAPDWTESNVRTMTQMFSKDALVRKVHQDFWKRSIFKGLGITAALNVVLAALDDDEDYFDKMKKAWEVGNLRWTYLDVTPLWELFGYNGTDEKYVSLIGHFKDVFKFLRYPGRSLKHKSSPVLGIIDDFFTGTDWKGYEFTTIGDFLGVDQDTALGKMLKSTTSDGELKFKTNRYGGSGTTDFYQYLSFLLYEITSKQPIAAQNIAAVFLNDTHPTEAAARSFGMDVASTYYWVDEERFEELSSFYKRQKEQYDQGYETSKQFTIEKFKLYEDYKDDIKDLKDEIEELTTSKDVKRIEKKIQDVVDNERLSASVKRARITALEAELKAYEKAWKSTEKDREDALNKLMEELTKLYTDAYNTLQ